MSEAKAEVKTEAKSVIKAKAPAAKTAPKTAPETEKADSSMLVVESRAKELVKSAGLRSGEEFAGALNDKVIGLVQSAGARAKGNGRVTIQAQDL